MHAWAALLIDRCPEEGRVSGLALARLEVVCFPDEVFPSGAARLKSPSTSVKPSSERSRRIIKRYSNRKLYDTRESRYVTLLQIADMVRAGEDVQIIDNASKEDKTEVTLALIISEELKSQPRSVPLGTLRDLIHQRGEKLLSQLREGPIARLIPGGPLDEKKEEAMPDSQEPGAKNGPEGTQARPEAPAQAL